MKAYHSTPGRLLCLALTFALCRSVGAEGLWQRVLRISGVSATPSLQKSEDGDLPDGGEIWIVDLQSQHSRKLAAASGYRSPVFTPDGGAVLALRSNAIWRVPLTGSPAEKLSALPNVSALPGRAKLVGFDPDDTNQLCFIVQRERQVSVQFLSLQTGQVVVAEYDPTKQQDLRLLSHLTGWAREYKRIRVYPARQKKAGVAGSVEWDDILVQRGGENPVNISRADGLHCGQPSLSPKGDQVVFIRTNEPWER